MDAAAIERQARLVQFEIWKSRELLFPVGVPKPLAMFQPALAARVLGLEFDYRESLGRFGERGDRFEIAGMLDRDRGIIAVSTRFPYEVQRFTGAHEIGHLVMHPQAVMHRDRPLNGSWDYRKPLQEREADYFAACYLAPKKLVEEEFKARFIQKVPLPLTDAVAFNLMGDSWYELVSDAAGPLDFAATVAGARSFNGKRFCSLAEYFGLSVSAMAIRLLELNLVEH